MRPAAESLRNLLQLGRYNHSYAKSDLKEHQHRRAIEICYLAKGCQTYRVGGEFFSLRGGDVFVTFPDETHSTGGLPEEKGVLYWMILALPRKGESLLGLAEQEGRALLRSLLNLKLRHFRGSSAMKEHLDAFTRAYFEKGDPLRSCVMANHAVAFLLEVAACARRPWEPRARGSLAPLLSHIHSHLGESLGIPDLAKMAGLSEARFKVRFKEETGVPPAEYVQRARIVEAGRRLSLGREPVTRIAFDLGFSSSQYFATVFKRYTRISPHEWSKKIRHGDRESAKA